MSHRLQFRRDTKERWLEVNPILMEGEVGYEIDTKNGKVGDGIHTYSELPYNHTITFDSITPVLGDSSTLVPSQKLVTDNFNRIDEEIGEWDKSGNGTILEEIGYSNVNENDLKYKKGLWGQVRDATGRISEIEKTMTEKVVQSSTVREINTEYSQDEVEQMRIDGTLNPTTLYLSFEEE